MCGFFLYGASFQRVVYVYDRKGEEEEEEEEKEEKEGRRGGREGTRAVWKGT